MKKMQSKARITREFEPMIIYAISEYYKQAISDNIKRALAHKKKMSTISRLDV